mmetsp:Transcript_6400/g.15855  ORF Transcript_6400/g.15855 Transcript_6400/m.15855 type:complete len:104 (-) Transcript_6400:512-823(-)
MRPLTQILQIAGIDYCQLAGASSAVAAAELGSPLEGAPSMEGVAVQQAPVKFRQWAQSSRQQHDHALAMQLTTAERLHLQHQLSELRLTRSPYSTLTVTLVHH